MRRNGAIRTMAVLFATSVLLNFPWEMAQSLLYAPIGAVGEATWRCFVASLGDGVMIFGIYAGGWLWFRRWTWFHGLPARRIAFIVVAGALIGSGVEWWGLRTGRWQYEASMPRVPGLELALVPLLQLPILAPLAFWLTRRSLDRILQRSAPRSFT